MAVDAKPIEFTRPVDNAAQHCELIIPEAYPAEEASVQRKHSYGRVITSVQSGPSATNNADI